MLYIVCGILVLFVFIRFPTLRCAATHPVKLSVYGIRDTYFYIRHKKWNEASFGKILCYIAESSTSFGCGKTLSATDAIVSMYRQYDGKPVWCKERKKFVTQRIKVLSNIDFLTIPYERLVSLGQFVHMANTQHDYDLEHDLLTVIIVVIDEASSQLNSRAFKENFDGVFIQNLLTARHVHASFFLTSQRAGMVDKLMRECTHMYIGCDKLWRFQRLSYYDAYEVENAQNPALVTPIQRTCWFITDESFDNYDTFASVQTLMKSCQSGDMLSEEEILALQVGQPANMDAVTKPSRRWVKNQKRIRK